MGGGMGGGGGSYSLNASTGSGFDRSSQMAAKKQEQEAAVKKGYKPVGTFVVDI